ncbi:hypothetical protein [Microvirga ossetica]|uniref:hypothetical protein n=1 Tax=Microvirga ossetica TaxID=1882682 RepID=UPI0012FFE363|nr:hypothetical protein [Microvirga ossetica]
MPRWTSPTQRRPVLGAVRSAAHTVGRDGLAIRHGVCGDCGSVHERDQNAVLTIARLGCETLGLKGPGTLAL